MPIGIPGSGKTRLYKKKYSHLTLLSFDLVCKEVTGDMNSKTNLFPVGRELGKRIGDLIKKRESFFLDNCNIYTDQRKLISNVFKGKDIKVTYVVLPSDIEVSKKRIEEDIKNGVERVHNSPEILNLSMNMYRYSIMSNFAGENVQEIIYLKPEDLD